MTEYERGEWNIFSLISSEWYGKGLYFLQCPYEDAVYIRDTGRYVTRDEAIEDFLGRISGEGEVW